MWACANTIRLEDHCISILYSIKTSHCTRKQQTPSTIMSTAAILSTTDLPASISGASSVSSLNSYRYSTVKDYPNSTALVVRDQLYVSSSSMASAPQSVVPLNLQITQYNRHNQPSPAPTKYVPRAVQPQLIATISVGFDKGDYLIREEKGHNVYFDFLEEAYNFIVQKGYSRMPKYEEDDYIELIKRAHKSVPGGCCFNPGKLLMVLKKKLVPVVAEYYDEKSMAFKCSGSRSNSKPKLLSNSSTTLPTDDESFSSNESYSHERRKSSTYEQSSCSTSYVDSWD